MTASNGFILFPDVATSRDGNGCTMWHPRGCLTIYEHYMASWPSHHIQNIQTPRDVAIPPRTNDRTRPPAIVAAKKQSKNNTLVVYRTQCLACFTASLGTGANTTYVTPSSSCDGWGEAEDVVNSFFFSRFFFCFWLLYPMIGGSRVFG